ncbi:hypothetical protein [Streptomyces sp. NPDC058985]|uniref:hypothetical protein n=1 Tax=Streptomyces sp. NPDC058985 TaxID=3346684 RepID=UPI0036AA15B5
MRLFTPTSPRPVAAAALLAACAAASAVLVPAVPAHAESPQPLPACTAPDDHTFPLTTRVHGGPDRYEPGGGFGVWYLDLTNTTSRTCSGVHPVVVLVDEERALEPSQPQLEFYDGADPRPVTLEKTDRDELIGAFGEGEAEAEAGGDGVNEPSEGDDAATDPFAGFTVAPGKTLTVKLRLSLTSDTAPGEVTANAAVVQRRDGDGEWIGQSNDYRFRVGPGTPADAPADTPPGTSPDTSPDGSATPENRSTGALDADELAGTGPGRVETALAVTLLLFAAGGTAVLLTRGRRR